jgi:hypothetical protein
MPSFDVLFEFYYRSFQNLNFISLSLSFLDYIRIFRLNWLLNIILFWRTLYFYCWRIKWALWTLPCSRWHRELSLGVEVAGLERILGLFLCLTPILVNTIFISHCLLKFLGLKACFIKSLLIWLSLRAKLDVRQIYLQNRPFSRNPDLLMIFLRPFDKRLKFDMLFRALRTFTTLIDMGGMIHIISLRFNFNKFTTKLIALLISLRFLRNLILFNSSRSLIKYNSMEVNHQT